MSRITSLYRPAVLTIAAACGVLFGAGAAIAAEEPAGPTLTGHVDLVSHYILRGVTSTYGPGQPAGNAGADAPESDKPVLQWGADYVDPSGLYVGYFGSMINYSYEQLGKSYSTSIIDFQKNKSIENDLYGGYNGKFGDVGYTVGATGYVYLNGSHSNGLETKLGISYGEFSAIAQTLLNDVVWGNKGDTYWTLNHVKALPYDITLTTSLGFYSYKKQGKYLGTTDTRTGAACPAGESFSVSGCLSGNAPSSGGFRHLIVGLTQPIGSTGATWGLQGILGGENRFGVKQGNKLVGSISYGF
ncbi:MAG: hypothetical protein ACI83P_001055 [Janthinobacterium sp.]|jgi:uncharacterized protein (TIGR02001 family)